METKVILWPGKDEWLEPKVNAKWRPHKIQQYDKESESTGNSETIFYVVQ